MSILAIIPARSGSKGIPGKNMKFLAGKPLIQWSIEAALASRFIDKIFVSTDDIKIAKFVEKFGIEVPFLRPKFLATDSSLVIDTVIHIIKNIDNYDNVLLLQPTSPLRSTNDIDALINLSHKSKSDSVVSITESIYKPEIYYYLNSNQTIKPLIDGIKNFNRQDLKKNYVLNGACYYASKEFILINKSFINKETVGYVMPFERSIDIDNSYDWDIAEFLIKAKTE